MAGLHSKPARRGVTLMEMLIVVALIGLLAGITFPSVTSGLDSLRMTSATDAVAGLFNAGVNRSERRQQAVEIEIDLAAGSFRMRSSEPGFEQVLALPEGVSIAAIHPDLPSAGDAPRRILLMPGGAPPAVGVELSNRRGVRRIVRLDPVTGVTLVERPEEP